MEGHRKVCCTFVSDMLEFGGSECHWQVKFAFSCRGLSPALARQVAEELTEKDVVRAHARDELGIDIDELANPLQVRVLACWPSWAGLWLQ